MCWEQNIFAFLKPVQSWASEARKFYCGRGHLNTCDPDIGWIWYEKKNSRGRAYSNLYIMFYPLSVFEKPSRGCFASALAHNRQLKYLAFPVIAILHIIVPGRKFSARRNIKTTINIATAKNIPTTYPFWKKKYHVSTVTAKKKITNNKKPTCLILMAPCCYRLQTIFGPSTRGGVCWKTLCGFSWILRNSRKFTFFRIRGL